MRPTHCTLALILLIAPVGASLSLAQGPYTVDRTDDDGAATACLPATPNDCSLRGAIRAANLDAVPSVVFLPDGLYQLTIEGPEEEFATTGDLDIVFDGLVLQSLPGAHPVIQQLTDDRIFDIDPSGGDVSFVGPLTLLDGTAFNSGGQERGGSIYFFRADSLTLTDVHMIGGFATDSGGCLEWAAPITPGTLTLTDVTFTGCGTEGMGGAFTIQNADSPVSLDRVEVKQNTAGSTGGGGVIFGGSATVVIQRSSFEHNTAAASFLNTSIAGGLFLGSGSFAIHESTFAHNTAGRTGGVSSSAGGIYSQSSLVLLQNTTLSDNRAIAPSSFGADLYVVGSDVDPRFATVKALEPVFPKSIQVFSGSTLDFFASVIEGECSNAGTINSQGLNVEYPPSGAVTTQCQLGHVSDILNASTLLKPLAGYGGPTPTHALLPAMASTAFNVPSPSCPDTDQRGAERLSLFCYSGAYEVDAQAPGSSIFSDGFESGNTAAWSASVP